MRELDLTTSDIPDFFRRESDVRRMWRLANIARHLGIPRTTLQSAAICGNLRAWRTQCGCILTTTEAVYEWAQKMAPPGVDMVKRP